MPGPVPQLRAWRIGFAATLAAAATAFAPQATGQQDRPQVVEARVATSVAPGKKRSLRLAKVPKSAAVQVNLTTDGPVVVAVVPEEDLPRYPEPASLILTSRVAERLSFTFLAPESGNYLVVLDNVSGDAERKVAVTVRGVMARRPADPDGLPPARRDTF
ncbi:MAG: hypothetical protein N2544_05445 [Burkholderiales bacterium]|nr:hypothetical protein [Burkholderiales bacterium]